MRGRIRDSADIRATDIRMTGILLNAAPRVAGLYLRVRYFNSTFIFTALLYMFIYFFPTTKTHVDRLANAT